LPARHQTIPMFCQSRNIGDELLRHGASPRALPFQFGNRNRNTCLRREFCFFWHQMKRPGAISCDPYLQFRLSSGP
jgi:hypothetical protein